MSQQWARPVARLHVGAVPTGATGINVEGRRPTGALQGFGQLWQKTYRVRLPGSAATPAEVLSSWRTRFTEFWPSGNHFYAPLTGIAPGEVALLELEMPGHMPLSTGMLCIYADDECFTLMTPQGHMESGWITFSAYAQDGQTVAQVQSIARAADPMYEIGFLLFAHRRQEAFWHETLRTLAGHFGVPAAEARVEMERSCLDPRWQWRQLGNVWQNAAARSTIYLFGAPIRWARRRRSGPEAR